MTNNLWVNERGRILGPYSIDKLKEMVTENWLSKMHLISEDQKTWINADEYKDGLLWNDSKPIDETPPIESIANGSSGETDNTPTEDSLWWYTKNGTQAGPIPLAQLKDLYQQGELKPDEQVWTENMPNWQPAFVITDMKRYLKLN